MPNWIRPDWALLVLLSIVVLWFILARNTVNQPSTTENFTAEVSDASYSHMQLMKAVGLAKTASEKLKLSHAEIAKLKQQLVRTPQVITKTPKPAGRCNQHSHHNPSCEVCKTWKARHPCAKCGDRCSAWAYGGSCGCSCHSKYDYHSLDNFKLRLRMNQLIEEKKKWQDMLRIQKKWLAQHRKRWHQPTQAPFTLPPTAAPYFPPPPAPTQAPMTQPPIIRPIVIKKQKRHNKKPWWYKRHRHMNPWGGSYSHSHPMPTTAPPAPPTTPMRPVVIRKKCKRHRKPYPPYPPYTPPPYPPLCPDGTTNCWPWPTPSPAPTTTTMPPTTTTTMPPTTTTTMPPTTTTRAPTTSTTTMPPTTTTYKPFVPPYQKGNWKMFKWAGKYMAIRQSKDYNIECMGNESGKCLFANTVRECATNIHKYGNKDKGTSLKCGADHKAVAGNSGYETGLHWCVLGNLNLNGKQLDLAGVKGGDFQCMAHNGKYVPVRLSANQKDPECIHNNSRINKCVTLDTPEECSKTIRNALSEAVLGDIGDGYGLFTCGAENSAHNYASQKSWCTMARNGVDGNVNGLTSSIRPTEAQPNASYKTFVMNKDTFMAVRLSPDANSPECMSVDSKTCTTAETRAGMDKLIERKNNKGYSNVVCSPDQLKNPFSWCSIAKRMLNGVYWTIFEAPDKRFMAIHNDADGNAECLSYDASTCFFTQTREQMRQVVGSFALYSQGAKCKEGKSRWWCESARAFLLKNPTPEWVNDIVKTERFTQENFGLDAFDGFTVAGVNYHDVAESSIWDSFAIERWPWTPVENRKVENNTVNSKASNPKRTTMSTKAIKKGIANKKTPRSVATLSPNAVVKKNIGTTLAPKAVVKNMGTTLTSTLAPKALVKKNMGTTLAPKALVKKNMGTTMTSTLAPKALVKKNMGTTMTTASRLMGNPLMGRTTTTAKPVNKRAVDKPRPASVLVTVTKAAAVAQAIAAKGTPLIAKRAAGQPTTIVVKPSNVTKKNAVAVVARRTADARPSITSRPADPTVATKVAAAKVAAAGSKLKAFTEDFY